MNKTFPIILITLISLPYTVSASDTLRCGTRLVQKHDLAIQVQSRCGKPISKEVIGYTLQEKKFVNVIQQREFKIEQWIYGPSNGYYDEIIFEGGRVKEINSVKY